ncbi:TauE protein [Ligilactobacillus pabuli]|uniref:Probable membrane transporter protein n=1 Tax=Ligilactobacillus pabuli TaxID=2886039 RepID=A0ABQ5JIP5_9LACO|nr:sulfite exporter TauE/SafE family protein [Ligilactobacillus pabuli]GKS81044.1 TauE protein [Ligilactobacillus pabuli]
MQFIILAVVGLVMGIATVITGGGAGAIYVSVLTIFFNISPAVATATSLATMFPTASVSTYLHARLSNVNFKIGWTMLGWGTIGALVGSYFSKDIPDAHYNTLIGLVIIVLTVLMIIKKRKPADPNSQADASKSKKFLQASFFGIISGLLSGLVGTSGTTAIIAGLTLLGCTTMQTVGTSVFVLAGISLVGFLMRAGVGTVDWPLAGVLAGSAIVGAIIGTLLLKKSVARQPAAGNNSLIDAVIILGNLAMGIALLFK